MAYAAELYSRYPEQITLCPKDIAAGFDLPALIEGLSPKTHVYACGPERLLTAIEDVIHVAETDRLHVERFVPREIHLDGPDQEFEVFCQRSGVEILVPVDESILMAADFAGIDIPGDCMEGTCGACETRIIEGEVDHRDSVLTPQARAANKTMMICVSRSKGGRLVIDL